MENGRTKGEASQNNETLQTRPHLVSPTRPSANRQVNPALQQPIHFVCFVAVAIRVTAAQTSDTGESIAFPGSLASLISPASDVSLF
jgi:hypothetical protein